MKIKEIILEYNRNSLATKLGEKLYAKLLSEPNDWQQRGVGFDINNIDKNKVIDAILEKIEAADPTKQKRYVTWIIRVYLNTNIHLEDAITKPTRVLAKFYKLTRAKKIQPPYNDIYQIVDVEQLEDVVSQFPDEEKQLVDKGNYQELYKDNEIRVIVPLDRTSACYYGQGTKWCTAANTNNMYDRYTQGDDKLYIILPQNPTYPGEKYQLSLKHRQIMNELDEPVNFIELLDEFPSLNIALKPDPHFGDLVVECKIDSLLRLGRGKSRNSELEKILIDNIGKRQNDNTINNYCYKYVRLLIGSNYQQDENLEKIQIAASKTNADVVRIIKDPSENVKRVAVSENGRIIQYIKNPSEEVQLAAVRNYGIVIKYIIEKGIDPSEAVQLAAVKEDIEAFDYIKKPTQKVVDYYNKNK